MRPRAGWREAVAVLDEMLGAGLYDWLAPTLRSVRRRILRTRHVTGLQWFLLEQACDMQDTEELMTEQPRRTWILYHANCVDGFTAAWVTRRVLQPTLAEGLLTQDVRYGEAPPSDIAPHDRVFIVDYCFPLEETLALVRRPGYTQILDHHKTSREVLEHPEVKPHAVWRDDRCGALVAWTFFFGGEPPPLLLHYVNDRDMWAWKMPQSKEFSAYLRSVEWDFDLWDVLADQTGYAGEKEQGAAILRYQDQQVALICDSARKVLVGGELGWAANTPVLQSEVCERLIERKGTRFGAAYYDSAERRDWSLRSRSDFDVGALAKLYGGGGHRQAAGFHLPLEDQWFNDHPEHGRVWLVEDDQHRGLALRAPPP